MDRFGQIYSIHKLLRGARHPVSSERLREALESCSVATLRRVIEDMRDYLGAPIETRHTDGGGYWYAEEKLGTYELPGLWFNASELFALVASFEMLKHVQPGVLDDSIAPLRERIQVLLAGKHLGSGAAVNRVRILDMAARIHDAGVFRLVAEAVLQRHILHMAYRARSDDKTAQRTVSPQRLTRYRDNWYLDAWCHDRKALRTFSMDQISEPHVSDKQAQEISDAQLDAELAGSYGIFAGEPVATAVLRFTPERARWVANEQWHPQQQGEFLENGSYELRIPYSNPVELAMDILKYGPDVEVVAPAELRQMIIARLDTAVAGYQHS